MYYENNNLSEPIYHLIIKKPNQLCNIEDGVKTINKCLDYINTELETKYISIIDALNNEDIELDATSFKTDMNMLFIELLPNYHYILKNFKTYSKKQFLEEIEKNFDTYKNPRNSMFYKSCEKSKFQFVFKNSNQILFNQANKFNVY